MKVWLVQMNGRIAFIASSKGKAQGLIDTVKIMRETKGMKPGTYFVAERSVDGVDEAWTWRKA